MELGTDITFKDRFIDDYVTANYRLPVNLVFHRGSEMRNVLAANKITLLMDSAINRDS